MKYIISIFLFSFLILGCKEPTTTTATQTKTNQEQTDKKYKNYDPIPSIPQAEVMKMWDECTLIDYIFHDLPFSMSQNEQGSIRANLNYISKEPVNHIPVECKAIGRQFFQVGGDIYMEADVYLGEGCKFYVFVENEKPKYANYMTEDGEKFFKTMFDQASGAHPNAGK